MIEIDTIKTFEKWLKEGIPYKAAIQNLNITTFENEILNHTYKGCLFLGCEMTNLAAGHISLTEGLVIVDRNEMSFKIHRAHLYHPMELFAGFDLDNQAGYQASYDYKIYKEYVETGMETPPSIATSLARRLHDHSITDALYEEIDGEKIVAIMGGHGMERQDPYYLKIAKISRKLSQKGFLMVSGGGPGAMEATHFGAYFAGRSEKEMIQALDNMKLRPANAEIGKEYADKDWLHRAWKVYHNYPIPAGAEKISKSIGVPTWLYGHEPPTLFATHIAKYFANSVREDGLLTIAKYGVIFAPGSAGTTQEIFQDAAQNHYAAYNTHDMKKYVSPMILFGVKAWTEDRPLWDFIQKTSHGRPYGELLHLTEDVDVIIERIVNYNPDDYAFPKGKIDNS
jgi:predicted Rossmann-fold nucleotide-binding protein